MTGLTTGEANACTVRAVDRAGNESDPYAINVPTKLYRWDIYDVGIEQRLMLNERQQNTGYRVCGRGYFTDE